MKLKEMVKNKREKKGDSKNAEAKMEVLKQLREMAMGQMGEGLDEDMQSVTVSAKDVEGLREGIDKAEVMLDQMHGTEDKDEEMMEDIGLEEENLEEEDLEEKGLEEDLKEKKKKKY